MINNFLNLLKPYNSLSTRYLLAVSGGIDSMVLVDLFQKADLKFGIAHCNFALRANESDGDEALVAEIAKNYGSPYFSIRFETKAYAENNGISIEMAARELRYDWFEKIRSENAYDFIVTAHHLNDQVETVFINLLRGCGIRGLTGMKTLNGKILRPLLQISRKEIEAYSIENQLIYRTDATNFDENFVRNKIRHSIVPIFDSINPSFLKTMQANFQKFADTDAIFNAKIADEYAKCVEIKGDTTFINIQYLKHLEPIHTYLFEFLKPFHFESDVVSQICDSLFKQSGKQFYSSTHQLIKDRDFLIIQKLKQTADICISFDESVKNFKINDYLLSFEFQDVDEKFILSKSPCQAFLDADLVKFPLTLRTWQKGDCFYPLGMDKRKKISDFLIDQKISLAFKKDIYVLISENEIIWVIGMRIDDRLKKTNETKHILKIEWKAINL